MIGIPWMLAFALRADGWWLRQDIIWCLSGGAWVYARTRKGDMPIMVKDLVRLDPRTVKLWNGEKWTQVLGWGPTPDATERLELVLRSGERIGCTGGHVWPTQRGNIAARDLIVGDVVASCELPEPTDRDWPQYLSKGALWLAGLYLAEGSRGKDALQFSLSADELPWFDRIQAIAQHYGGTATYTISGGSLNVRVWGRVIRAVIDSYVGGAVALDKHLKVRAWRLPNEALRCLIDGYLDGDGHHDRGNNRWRLGFCRNYALERDLRTAAARLGAALTLKPGVASYQGGEQPNFRGEWRWERSGHWNEKDRGEVVEIRNSRARKFWDIGVEDEPHLFALASGVLTHNSKPNPMPESVTDRCTKAHEYLFLLSKSERYWFDQDAIADAAITAGGRAGYAGYSARALAMGRVPSGNETPGASAINADTRNKRSVWTVASEPFPDAHFATFPPALIEPCILAGCPKDCCAKCGAPWVRLIENSGVERSRNLKIETDKAMAGVNEAHRLNGKDYVQSARHGTGSIRRRRHDRPGGRSPQPRCDPDRAQFRLRRNGPSPHPRRCALVRGGCMTPSPRYPTIAEIQAAVVRHFELRAVDMVSARRSRRVARPRQIAMALAVELTPASLPVIGRHFGNRDHTTVMHAVRRVKELNEYDIEVAYDVAAIKAALADPHQL